MESRTSLSSKLKCKSIRRALLPRLSAKNKVGQLFLLFFLFFFGAATSVYADDLLNGGSVSGSISVIGEVDSWTFDANVGDYALVSVVDVNSTNLSALVTITAPDDTVLTTGQGNTVSKAGITALQSGTYTVTIRDNSSSSDNDEGTGDYLVYFVKPPVSEHGDLVNGGFVSETMELGDIDTWSFDAEIGDFALVSLVDVDDSALSAFVAIYAPDGTLVTTGQGNTVSKAQFVAGQSGNYTVMIQDNSSSSVDDLGTGDYRLYFVKPPVSEHGDLINGGSVSETIEQGDIDTWSFDAEIGDFALVSLVDVDGSALSAFVSIYAPDGTLVTTGQGNTVSKAQFVAGQSGTYTVMIQDNSSSSVDDLGTGDYRLYFVKPPLSEHGDLINGGFVSETMELGDIDTWSFDAEIGDFALVSLVDVDDSALSAFVAIYAPDGTLVTTGQGNTVSKAQFVAGQSGTYTVMIQDNSSSSVNDLGTGDYRLYFVKPPLSEHGDLINGGFVSETMELGDIDTWSFDAEIGDFALVSLVDVDDSALSAFVAIYAPDGTLVTTGQGNTVSKAQFVAGQSGTYTVMIQDNSSSSVNDLGTGDYRLYFVKPSVSEHGDLINGGFVSETIELGDIDTWSFDAEIGDFALVSLADVDDSALSALVSIYAPDGTLIITGQGNTVSKAQLVAGQSGTYTVIIQDNSSSSVDDLGTGDYRLYYVGIPGAQEHGLLSGSGTLEQRIDLGDLDTFIFEGNATSQVSFIVTDIDLTNLTPTILLFDPQGTFLTQRIDTQQAELLDFSLPVDGLYTLLIIDNSSSSVNDTGVGDYRLDYNVPETVFDEAPVAIAQVPAEVFRGEDISLNGSNSFDPDNGPAPLTYSWTLLSAPANSQITQSDIMDANLSIANFVADVSGEYELRLTVFDGQFSSEADAVVIAINRIPVADAGDDMTNVVGQQIELDGSDSSDGDGDQLTFSWQFVSLPDQSNLTTIANAANVQTAFTPDVMGTYEIGLIVNDGEDSSVEDIVVINIEDLPNLLPIANINVTGQLEVGGEVNLDGSQSIDPDNGPNPLLYSWKFIQVPPGSGLNTSNIVASDEAVAQFVADIQGLYQVELRVEDGLGFGVQTVDIVVSDAPVAPVANAGNDVSIELGGLVQLDGSASHDPDNSPQALSFVWQFVSVPNASNLVDIDINNANGAVANFAPDVAGEYLLQLEVADGLFSDTDNMLVTVTSNTPPVANAGEDQQVDLGMPVSLDGTSSNDPDNGPDPLTFSWTFSLLPVDSLLTDNNIETADTASAAFVPDVAGVFELQLSVSDGQSLDSDSVIINVANIIAPRMCDVDLNGAIDRNDIIQVMAKLNTPATGPSDPADWDQDDKITVLDARGCVLSCDLPRCAIAIQ